MLATTLQRVTATSTEHLNRLCSPLTAPRHEFAVSFIRQLRRDLGWPDHQPPDVNLLLHSAVTQVVWLDPDLIPGSAHTGRSPSGELVTALNSAERHLTGRMRWTKAHEVCHVLLGHFSTKDTTDEHILCREADIAVTELLLPETGLKRIIAQEMPHVLESGLIPGEIGWLKNYFRVSWDALMIRLEELDIQRKGVSQALCSWWNNRRSFSSNDPTLLQALRILKQRGIEIAS